MQEADLAELLVLQRCCWVQEAIANDTLQIAALHETAADLAAWAATWRVWCVRRNGRLVAAVRAHADEPSWEIGRLMVAPDLAGNGVGRWLLDYAENQAPPGVTRFVLSTGRFSDRNIALYQRAGYTIETDQRAAAGSVQLTRPRPRTRGINQQGGNQ
ncbi:MAG: GNAT family N-acetyltransferase [Streptosporangiales bacterium]